MNKNWKLNDAIESEESKSLSELLNINVFLSSLLIQRGIDSFDKAKAFFRPNLSHLHNPFLMQDMDKAVMRIKKAIDNQQKIMVYGDYDVDGTTSVALVYHYFSQIYSPELMTFYIPDRYKEGYGISTQGIDFAYANGFSLIIALDCGIKSIDKINYANSLHIDFIICDHHQPGETIPEAVAVLDPKRVDCKYPFKELSGCGIGFKLIQAYDASYCQHLGKNLDEYFDLLVLSIGADIVPMVDENRILSYFGIKRMNENPRYGIRALMGVAGFKKDLTITDVVFGLAPRINAAGRIHHADGAVKLLLAQNEIDAKDFAQNLQESNTSRKDIDSVITCEALEILIQQHDYQNLKSTVLFKNDWHKGVIGIVASRCIESHYKPTIILTESNGKAAGSARSVDGFDVYEAISECADLLEQFGGHKYAAGMTMELKNVNAFRQKFESVVAKRITAEQLIPKIKIDMKVDLGFVCQRNFNIIKQMQPFGPGNMTPIFCTHNLVSDTKNCKIVGNNHLKLCVWHADNSAFKIDAIAFGMAEYLNLVTSGKTFALCYVIEENNWKDTTTLQMMVRAVKFAEDL